MVQNTFFCLLFTYKNFVNSKTFLQTYFLKEEKQRDVVNIGQKLILYQSFIYSVVQESSNHLQIWSISKLKKNALSTQVIMQIWKLLLECANGWAEVKVNSIVFSSTEVDPIR